MNEKLEKIKAHIKSNKAVYLVAGAVVTAAGCVYVGYRVGSAKAIEQQLNNSITQIGIGNTATLEVYVEALGDPGNIIQDITTGTIYASQRQAARELGLDPARVSEQVRGIRDHVNGHKFEFLAKAIAPERVS